MKYILSIFILFSFASNAVCQLNPCGFSLVATAASCDTCCDACIAVAINGNCSVPTYTITWSPFYAGCNACPGTTYTATIQDNYGNTIIDSITVDTIQVNLNIESTDNSSEIKIFPNPAKSSITIEANFQIESVIIFDAKGSKISNDNLCGCFQQPIDISELVPGIYFLQIYGEEKLDIKKIIKV